MKSLKTILATGLIVATALLSSCAGYNVRMSSITIDREQKRDWMVGYAGLAKGGSVSGVGGLVVMLDNPWYSKVIPIYNQHTATQAEEENQRTTIQLGSIGFCFTDKNKGNLQLGYLNINNGPTYFCPLLDWRHGKK